MDREFSPKEIPVFTSGYQARGLLMDGDAWLDLKGVGVFKIVGIVIMNACVVHYVTFGINPDSADFSDIFVCVAWISGSGPRIA